MSVFVHFDYTVTKIEIHCFPLLNQLDVESRETFPDVSYFRTLVAVMEISIGKYAFSWDCEDPNFVLHMTSII